MFAIIKGSEDGNPLTVVSAQELEIVLRDPISWGSIKEFRDEKFLLANPDPNYWGDGVAVLLRFQVVVPKPVVMAWGID